MKVEYHCGDIVRILTYAIDHPNAFGRVDCPTIHDGYYKVTNMNMPFQGTLCGSIFYHTEL